MNSLFLSITFPPETGGIQTILYEIVKNYPVKSIVVARQCKNSEGFDKRLPFKVIRIKNSAKTIYKPAFLLNQCLPIFAEFFSTVDNLLKKEKIDVIHCGHISTALLGYYAWKKYGIPYVIYTYGQEVMPPYVQTKNPLNELIIKKVFANAKTIFTMSEFTKSFLVKYAPENKIRIVALGATDPVKFSPKNRDKTIEKKLGKPNHKIILTVTRLEQYKGIDYVLKALKHVRRKIPNVKYVIIGDGEEKHVLEKIAKQENVSDVVEFIGGKPNTTLPFYYNTADLFILNSRNCLVKNKHCKQNGRVEGFAIVFLEAGACQKPVIAGNSGGVPDAVINKKTGLLVDPLDEKAIADAIVKLLLDKKLARRMGKAARKRVLEKNNFKSASREIYKIIKQLV